MVLSPRKVHPISEGADTKDGNRINLFFWTFTTPMNQTPPKKWFFTQFAGVLKILFIKINYYFDLFEGSVLPMLLFLYFQIPQARAISKGQFQKCNSFEHH